MCHILCYLNLISKVSYASPKESTILVISSYSELIRRANEKAYEPKNLSIGPYHRSKSKLQDMENFKLRYLKRIPRRKGESSVKRYIAVLMEFEEKARSYYAENINLSREDFVDMFFLMDNPQEDQRNDDPIFLLLAESWCRDLLLFENQIPFFILVKLFDMTKVPSSQEKGLIHLAISHLYPLIEVDQPPESSYNIGPEDEIRHLLNLLYKSWCSSMETEDQELGISSSSSDPKSSDFYVQSKEKKEENPLLTESIKSINELRDDGIMFKKANQRTSWLDIKNLIIYEQYMFDISYSSWNFVTSYSIFMDFFINSLEDVKTLRKKKIIKCWLSNDEEVADMFNKICKNLMFLSHLFLYKKFFKDVNEYCSKRRNTWWAHLKNDYFSNPWSIISFLAATLLLLLTIIQTVCSVHQALN
ncbi:hypothetical protein M9H77_35839 [Catharanthus roseus]|uniref:Uncharacterized protein n=1 Tax=Catharanthus roseus TaxID=4058 RepID=A0ACB9ZQ57_CATRO|nr:hypothetical protein M9H77_35839 [Catharanthus roseus]